jgi:hypothetical protein
MFKGNIMSKKSSELRGGIKALILSFIFITSSSFLYANTCPKWFPLPVLDGLVVVIPVYDVNITEPDFDCDGIVDTLDEDIDGDGVLNARDAFPLNPNESIDTDGDGIGNNADLDDDNDGYSDVEEIAFGSDPLDANSIPVVVSNDGFIVTPLVGTSSQVSFAIALKHKPESNVSIAYGSADETVAKPTANTMTFTSDNWYRSQVMTVDILNPSSSTEIVFEPTLSSDSNYNNKMLEQVSIVSHQLLLYEPVDKVVYSEFNMSIPINMAYVGDNEENITVILDTAPADMTLDSNNSRLLWNPPLSTEGQNSTVVVTVSDGSITSSITFELHVAQPTLLTTSIVDDKLVITDSNSSLNGSSIQALDGAVLSDYRLYKLSTTDTPAFREGEFVVGETLLIKGNIGKTVQVLLPLQGLVETDEILSFHTKSYFGSGNWRRVDYDYDFVGTLSEPVYVLNTESLFGVVVFTKILQSQQAKVSSSSKKLKVNSEVNCVPQTWSFLNLTDYDNQICTFDANSTFRLQIFNYPDATISSNTPIEEVVNWVIKAQDKLIELGMPYQNYGALSFEEMRKYGTTTEESSPYLSLFLSYPTIMQSMLSKIKRNLSFRDSQVTLYHEYFHQSQATIQNNTLDMPKAAWLIEASAFWFSDYADDNSGYAYTNMLSPASDRRIFRDAIMRSENIASPSNPGFGQGGIMHETAYAELYDRSLFLEMLENYCPNFTDYMPYLFQKDINDPTSLQHLSNVVYSSNCNFGTSPTGQGNESLLETAILYYQYISDIKQLDNLINPNIPVGGVGFLTRRPWDFTISDFRRLSLGQYSVKEDLSGLSKDSRAGTAYIPQLSSTLPRCQERYIRIKSEKTVLVSLSSNDTSFPNTPNTMLGDMKQINFGMVGKTDFTYFYDQNTGKQIYPEMYLTITDVVDDTTNLTPQNVEVGIGLRGTNLLSHIDGKDMCAEYAPQITETTVVAKGEIPPQYRDSNEPLQYIDRIKMTCLESGEVFNATVASDGTWYTNINITFNGNESRFSIEGYNSSDTQRIISYQGLTIVR